MSQLTLVTGAGGFIGGQLVRHLLAQGVQVRAVDKKPIDDWYFRSPDVENVIADLQGAESCNNVTKDAVHIYNLAADMGGMGFIENNKALCMLSVLINTHMLMAAHAHGVERFFFSSSACVYAAYKQTNADVVGLKESDAYPADARRRLRLGKVVQRAHVPALSRGFRPHDAGRALPQRLRSLWNVGRRPREGTGRDCRKVAMAVIAGKHEIEIWGDGEQTRSFMYIDDCVIGTRKLMHSDIVEPINIGSDEMVTINQLVDIVEEIAGIKLKRNYKLDAPKGVRGRNSDNTLIKERLAWAPSTSLRTGMERTYRWIYDQAKAREEGRPYIAAAA